VSGSRSGGGTRPLATSGLRPSRIEIDVAAIRRNVEHLRRVADAAVCAVVKADGYGHGAVPVARAAVDGGAAWLAVALVEEGIALREAGIEVPILVLSEPPVAAIPDLLAARLTPTVYRAPFLASLDATGHARGRPIPVHVKLDTGMARAGVPPAEWRVRLEQAASARGLVVEGLLTHLARSEELGVATTREQLASFERGRDLAARLGLGPRWIHAANTAAVLAQPAARYTLVRPGIGVYGLSPGGDVTAADHGLEPALRLVTEVAYAKRIAAGTPVSYGHRWRAPVDGWIATLPVGYGDGVPRALTNRAQVLVRGGRHPMVGTVCMDQVLVWCGDLEPSVGEEVVLLGEQGEERIRVEEWATAADTITYEIVTQLTTRLPRHHLG
jgi:alanine racemase